jgi:pyruvate dehydrogenase E2 component (dihydrolipoamide acetyltransferase)
MPKVGLTMSEGTIAQWHKQEGEAVRKGDVLFTFETEKSTLEFESPFEGVLQRILVPAGQVTPCLTPVASIVMAAETPGDPLTRVLQPPTPSPVPATASRDREPAAGRPVSPRARLRARELHVEVSAVTGSGPDGTVLERDVLAYHQKLTVSGPEVRITPLAQRVASELGVDLASVQGSGPAGHITRDDIARSAEHAAQEQFAPAHAAAHAPAPAQDEGEGELQPLTAARHVTAQRTAESARTIPHVTLTTEADATALVSAREQLNTELAEITPNEKLSYNALLVAIVGRTLREHPELNASWDERGILLHHGIHVGVAVDTSRGLYVPVVRDATRPLMQLHRDLTDLVARAQAGTLIGDELAGGTFTITNLGMFEIDAFTPIINAPQAGILGVGRIVGKPVARGEQVVVRQMMALSLSFDHRVVDGAPAARFLQRVKALIERPFALLA